MIRLVAVLMLGLGLSIGAPMARADHGQGKEHGSPHGNGPGKSHGNKHYDEDDRNWDRRDGYEYRVYHNRGEMPVAWERGKKTGWGNCGMPPGQAKKYGCRSYVYQGRTHYYYEDDRGQIIVRRPTIALHGSVDVVR